MPEIEFDPVDAVTAGSVGEPGHRVFYLHATRESAALTVKLEKEQVAVLAVRLVGLLEAAGVEDDEPDPLPAPALSGEVDPLFRAVAIGIGFDPSRQLVVLELHERAPADADDDDELVAGDEDEGEGWVARLHITPAQARAVAARGAEAVAGGRPICALCKLPIDPDGHTCPATNGHRPIS